MSDLTTTHPTAGGRDDTHESRPLALALVYSVHEPWRAGEIAWLNRREPVVLGRGGDLDFVRHRPRERTVTGPLADPAISRRQLVLQSPSPNRVSVERVGRLGLRINGVPVDEAELRAGDVVELGDRAVLLVHDRAEQLAGPRPRHPFGEADAQGFVGEGSAAWALRARVAFVARRQAHVMVYGESGTGPDGLAQREYTRLGEAQARKADLRLVAATNRPLGELKPDVLARIPLRVATPGLSGCSPGTCCARSGPETASSRSRSSPTATWTSPRG